MSKFAKDKNLIMFPKLNGHRSDVDPLTELLNEYSHLNDEDVVEYIDFSELKKDELKSLLNRLKILAKEQKRLQFYIDQIEQNLSH
ncbi:MAG: hypothetical protein OEY33_09495 [Bdellovibrionales bacterium]|nr:hypothetical protein [Bdellovibrionales bacterium]